MNIDPECLSAEIYDLVREIPAGRVATYGMVARLAGIPSYARWVGRVLSQAPPSFGLPCHRVVNSQGRLVPYWPEQRKLLEQEGVILKKNGTVDLRKYLWNILHETV